MDLFHNWFNLKPGVRDTEFCDALTLYLSALKDRGDIVDYRVMRRKLAFGPSELGEFHVVIETDGLAQLDRAFGTVSARSGAIESLHAAVNQHVCDLRAALYRDFPDSHRQRSEEQF